MTRSDWLVAAAVALGAVSFLCLFVAVKEHLLDLHAGDET